MTGVLRDRPNRAIIIIIIIIVVVVVGCNVVTISCSVVIGRTAV